jgi:hypothetical protein
MEPYTTHTKTFPDHTKVDVFKLTLILKDRSPETRSLSELKGVHQNKGFGYSTKRVETADTSLPVIIDDTGFVIDGNHRVNKLLAQGETQIKVLVATKEDIEKAKYTSEDDLVKYSDLA